MWKAIILMYVLVVVGGNVVVVVVGGVGWAGGRQMKETGSRKLQG